MHASRIPFLLASISLVACAGAQGVPSGPSSAPSSNVYLRNSFDTDPSIYLGRFVPREATDLDEGSAMPLACTEHVEYRFIDGGGVKITESMSVSTEVAARIGVPIVASGTGSGSRTGEVKVEYTLTGKMVADVADPAAFNACCKAQPDQCTDRFIGEFLQGTGTVYRQQAREFDVGGKGTDPQSGVSGSAAVSHDKQWSQAIEFPNPVYFAFKVTRTPNTRAVSSCGTWVDTPPVEPGSVFFVGTSRGKNSERAARGGADRDARFEAIKSVAASIPMGPDGEPDPSAQAAVNQWAMSMQTVESCVEVDKSGRKPRYVGRTLGKLPVFEGVNATSPPPPANEPPASPADLLDVDPGDLDLDLDEDWGDGL
ncbi:MAG: hypothetical protein AB1Z98_15610 [Nannocystaceae bacterium]